MIGERIEDIIEKRIKETLDKSKEVEMPEDIIETDNIGEVIEKLAILHCRMWYLEDAIGMAKSDTEIADLKRKIDICFKVKRPKYVEAINKMIDKSIKTGKSLQEDSVKLYQGFKDLPATVRRTNPQDQEWIKQNRADKTYVNNQHYMDKVEKMMDELASDTDEKINLGYKDL